MCEFPSWIERRDKVYFLTYEQLFLSEKGKELLASGVSPDDRCGHGTIRAYYGIDEGDGVDKECNDFSKPTNFPPKIVEAIKSGKMRGLGTGKGLLKKAIDTKWQSELDAAYAKRQSELDAAYAKWQPELDAAYAKWQPELGAAYAKWQSELDAIDTKRQSELGAAYAKWQPELDAAYAKFWDLFAIPENRNPKWR